MREITSIRINNNDQAKRQNPTTAPLEVSMQTNSYPWANNTRLWGIDHKRGVEHEPNWESFFLQSVILNNAFTLLGIYT